MKTLRYEMVRTPLVKTLRYLRSDCAVFVKTLR